MGSPRLESCCGNRAGECRVVGGAVDGNTAASTGAVERQSEELRTHLIGQTSRFRCIQAVNRGCEPTVLQAATIENGDASIDLAVGIMNIHISDQGLEQSPQGAYASRDRPGSERNQGMNVLPASPAQTSFLPRCMHDRVHPGRCIIRIP